MTTLQALTEEQTRRTLGVTSDEFEYLRNPSPDHLHDPFYYKDMRELITHLHKFKQKQKKNPNLLLVVDGDYDTDGIMASTILSASLSVFDIEHRTYIPSMSEGYGLSKQAVNNMKSLFESDNNVIGMILTADNGVNAFDGIAYAKEQNIQVLVTDHHPSGTKLPSALAIVNPNRSDDLYPFKGNSGACVAWKVMLAYAKTFQKEDAGLIERLIVFAGLANVADVMPILNENRYIVKAAIKIVNDLIRYKATPVDYTKIMNTPYEGYNTVFHGLYDLIMLLQKSNDDTRRANKKSTIPLPTNEELFGWYLSPLLNAPRRVHETCLEGMVAFLVSDTRTRHIGIDALIELNKEKSKLRDKVLAALKTEKGKPDYNPYDHIVMCVNTRAGISGLIAGDQSNKTGLPSIVFSCDRPDDSTILYKTIPSDVSRITASARSNALYPLNMIMDQLNAKHPGLVSGGGHASAAGFTIDAKNYLLFKQLFIGILPEIYEEMSSHVESWPENIITLNITTPNQIVAEYTTLNGDELLSTEKNLDIQTFAHSISETINFQDSLRPFGQDFNGKTMFKLRFNNAAYLLAWQPDFWQTFKFNLFGVEILTFDTKWADSVKYALEQGQEIIANVELKLNTFREKVTPQFILTPSA